MLACRAEAAATRNPARPVFASLRRGSLRPPLRSGRRLVGGAGNAPVVTSDSYLRHRFYRPAAGTPPLGKSEIRTPNLDSHCADSSGFGLRNSFGLRGFFRISDFPRGGVPAAGL